MRRGLSELLNSVEDFEVVGEAGTVAEALRRIPPRRPDVAILDGRLPDGSGIEVCRIIREEHPNIRCLILTSYDDDEAIFAAVLAGAAGYVLKQIRGSNLVDAVRQVAAGQSLLDPSVTDRVLRRIREGKQEDARLASLNAQERKILVLIAEGLTNRQIGERLFLAEKTVKNNVSSLLAKLGMQRRTQAAVFGANLRDSNSSDRLLTGRALPAGVVGRLDRHLDVVRVRLLEPGLRDADELPALGQLGNRARADVEHRLPQPADELVGDGGQRAAVGHAALDALGHDLVVAGDLGLEVAVLGVATSCRASSSRPASPCRGRSCTACR